MHITPQNAQKPKSVKFYRNCCDTAQLKLQLRLEQKPTISLAYKLKAHHRLACFCDKGNLKIALTLWLHTHTCILLFSLCVSPVCVSPPCVFLPRAFLHHVFLLLFLLSLSLWVAQFRHACMLVLFSAVFLSSVLFLQYMFLHFVLLLLCLCVAQYRQACMLVRGPI